MGFPEASLRPQDSVEVAGDELFAFTGSGALTVCMFGVSRRGTHESLCLKEADTQEGHSKNSDNFSLSELSRCLKLCR